MRVRRAIAVSRAIAALVTLLPVSASGQDASGVTAAARAKYDQCQAEKASLQQDVSRAVLACRAQNASQCAAPPRASSLEVAECTAAAMLAYGGLKGKVAAYLLSLFASVDACKTIAHDVLGSLTSQCPCAPKSALATALAARHQAAVPQCGGVLGIVYDRQTGIITHVVPNSAAATAGLRANDRIGAYGGTLTPNGFALALATERHVGGETVSIVYLRNQTAMFTTKATLAAR